MRAVSKVYRRGIREARKRSGRKSFRQGLERAITLSGMSALAGVRPGVGVDDRGASDRHLHRRISGLAVPQHERDEAHWRACQAEQSGGRAAGDEERAVMLEKRYEVLLKQAERGAL